VKKVLLFSTLSLFVASLASAQITPHFDVDFNQDTVGLPPAVGVEPFPSSQPTAIASFGLPDPIVVSAVGDDDQAVGSFGTAVGH